MRASISIRRQTVLIGVATILLVLLFGLFGAADIAELRALDTAFALRGVILPQSPLVIVAIDDESLSQTGLAWPWSREYFAQIVDRLALDKPSVIGIDIVFYEPQPGDDAFARALQRAGKTVLANSITVVNDPAFRLEQLSRPVDALAASATAIGLANFPLDGDGFARRILAYQRHNAQLYYHWAVQTAVAFWDETLPGEPRPDEIMLKARAIALSDQSLRVNFRGPARTFKTLPAYQVVNGDIPPGFFQGKIVLIGATTQTLHDTYPTPFRGSTALMPGVEIGANAIETILTGDYLYRLPRAAEFGIAFAFGVVGLAFNALRRPWFSLVVLAGLLGAYAALWYALFVANKIELPLMLPLATLFFAFIVPMVERAVVEEAEKRRVRAIFERFISREMVEQLVERGIESSRGKRAELTILFADIRGFTTLSEKLAPDEIVRILNDYLAAMTRVIFRHGGTIDKFEGDAIVAFWGAPTPDPRHAVRALAAALEMQEELARLRAGWRTRQDMCALEIGIGLNTSEVFVGLIGSEQRVNYTVIGDGVNLAARLQELTKEYLFPVLISESTFLQIQSEFAAEFVAARTVRGKTVPVKVYRVLERKEVPQ